MTTPAFHFNTASHRYKLDGMNVPGVTTILDALPKPFLKFWGERMVATWAYDQRDAWKDLPRDAAIDMLRREPLRFTGKAARRGTCVHSAINAHALGYDPPEDLTDEEWGYFNGALKYLTDHKIQVERTETTVYSRRYGYAGTFDLIQTRAGTKEIADFKTSKAVYAEVALQLVGYARADFIGDAQTGEEIDLPKLEQGVIVRLASDGTYEAVPVTLTDELFAVFLAVQGVHGWTKGLSQRVLEPALRAA